LRFAVDPDRVLEIAAHAVFVVVIGPARPEASAMAGARIVPIGFAAGFEGPPRGIVGPLAIIVIEPSANRTTHHGAQGSPENCRSRLAASVTDGAAEKTACDAADHRATRFLRSR